VGTECNSAYLNEIFSSYPSDRGFGTINDVYGSYFDEKTAPARETVQVACLPKNLNIEISMIAFL
jgi:enamine deaminase RidA (YjgF/YER057c/UK114 family)